MHLDQAPAKLAGARKPAIEGHPGYERSFTAKSSIAAMVITNAW